VQDLAAYEHMACALSVNARTRLGVWRHCRSSKGPDGTLFCRAQM